MSEATPEKCWFWPFTRNPNGYAEITLNGKKARVHRLICERVHGPAPEANLDAAHSCGNGHFGCINPHHVRWDTRSGNCADKTRHGTDNRGSRHPMAKLSETNVRYIRAMSEQGLTKVQLAEQFKVSPGNIALIVSRKSWAHLDQKKAPHGEPAGPEFGGATC
jgi:hypothetical protein